MHTLGYACINTALSANGISVIRGMIRKTFDKKGLPWCGELAEKNLIDLLTIFTWNYNNRIHNYRMSSDMFPWMSEYELDDLPNFHYSIVPVLEAIGQSIIDLNQKVSFHPGQFDCLASPNQSIVEKTIFDLEQHSRIMDFMKLPATHQFNINIHVGGVYGDKERTLKRFAENFKRLSDNLKNRLTIENDDGRNGYRVEDLIYLTHAVSIPIVFDTLHWQCNSGSLDYNSAFRLAYSTWNQSIVPEIHHASSRKLYEDPSSLAKAHADFIYEPINTLGLPAYVTIESKMKEQALLRYREQFV